MFSAPLVAASGAIAALALHGCGQGPAPAPTPTWSSPLQATSFVKYPTYTGDLSVSGTVSIGEVDTNVQVIFASLTGVDPLCTGAQSGAGNVCGMHIHSGTTCSEGTGGHYFNVDADPWVPVTFTDPSGVDNQVEVSDIVVSTGFSLADLQGRVFVVHDSTGARVACGQLAAVTGSTAFKVPSFVKYPGSSTSFAVSGEVDVVSTSDTQILRFALFGADPTCTPDATISAANGCGIHFHTGTSCDSSTGGHYWSSGTITEDPWKKITYRNEVSRGATIPIVTGLTTADVSGRVVVVHDKTGARIACGVMGAAQTSVSVLDHEEAPSTSPLVWFSAVLVIALLGGGAWYYRSQRRGYASQQDDSTEVKNAAAQQDESIEMHNAA